MREGTKGANERERKEDRMKEDKEGDAVRRHKEVRRRETDGGREKERKERPTGRS